MVINLESGVSKVVNMYKAMMLNTCDKDLDMLRKPYSGFSKLDSMNQAFKRGAESPLLRIIYVSA